jgi:hypothetical protein
MLDKPKMGFFIIKNLIEQAKKKKFVKKKFILGNAECGHRLQMAC